MPQKQYKLNGKTYTAKAKYSLQTWGKILSLLKETKIEEGGKVLDGVIVLLKDNLAIEMLNLILSEKVEGELYEDDIQEVGVIISDFFTRKKSLISIGRNDSKS